MNSATPRQIINNGHKRPIQSKWKTSIVFRRNSTPSPIRIIAPTGSRRRGGSIGSNPAGGTGGTPEYGAYGSVNPAAGGKPAPGGGGIGGIGVAVNPGMVAE